jgi:hypothetical protein
MIKLLRGIDLAWRLSWRWKRRFRQDIGHPPTRRDWWNHEFSRQVSDWTEAHWASTSALRSTLFEAGVTVKSGDATWTVDELSVVERVVGNVAQAFGRSARSIVGGVLIRRTRVSQFPLGFAWKRCLGWEGLGTVRLNDSAFALPGRAERVLTHEFGHYLLETQGLINQFLRATGGYQFNLLGAAQLNLTPYRCGGEAPNDWLRENGVCEDFAGSFETFVYHQIGRPHADCVLDVRRAEFFEKV